MPGCRVGLTRISCHRIPRMTLLSRRRSIHKHQLIRHQQNLAIAFPGSQRLLLAGRLLEVRRGRLVPEETESPFDFVRGGIALIDELIEVANSLRLVIESLEGGPTHHLARLFHDEGAVQKEQRLLRHGGGVTLGRGHIRVGEIEDPEQRKQVVAIDDSIDRAAMWSKVPGWRSAAF